MTRVSGKSAPRREKLGLLVLGSPDILFLLVLCGFGGAAAGWVFIGVGVLLALIPMIGFALYYWARLRRKRAGHV